MKIVSVVVVAAMALAVTWTAKAQQPRAQADSRVTSYDFRDGDAVTGTRQSGEGERVMIRRPGEETQLLRPRTHFVHELVKSVETL